MPDPGLNLLPASSSPPFLTELPEVGVGLVYNRNSCFQLAAVRNENLILLHYRFMGKMTNRRPQEAWMDTAKVAYITLSCLIVLENLLVLLAILKNLRARRWVYSCIASITVSDLLAGVAYIINLCLSGHRTFQLTPKWWFVREGFLFVALAASIFSLLVTAVERYSAMVRPIAENEASKTTRLRVLIVACWCLAFLIGLFPILGWNCLCDFHSCSSLLPLLSKSYILFCVVMFSVLLLGIAGFYAAIYHLVRTSVRPAVSKHSQVRSLKLLKTVSIILGAFIVCWTPLFIQLLHDVFCNSQSCKQHSLEWALALAVFNSAINPIIYAFRSREVRRAVIGLICCCCINAGLRGPRGCLDVGDIHSGSSTESSLRIRESFRNSVVLNRRKREPLTSLSSALSSMSSI
uniref:Sphingosine-1-phosphate receptor 4 n=1 Tax=Sphenodon punctatus TaxID=8508 RepID=A0A8D0GWQ5_SPHPU